jgi:CheY-like chemotaxis protein
MNTIQRVIMVDDDPYSHMICSKIIRRIVGEIEIVEFVSPEEGIQFIETVYREDVCECNTVLLLDINMPIMNGWEFLERYDKASNRLKKQFTVYLLSSSVDHRDRERAAANKYVKDFLMKPFKKEMVEAIFKNIIDEKELLIPLH